MKTKRKTPLLLKRIFSISVVAFACACIIALIVRIIELLSPMEYRNVRKMKNHVRSGKPIIAVLWHSRGLFMTKVWRANVRRPLYGIFSNSRDGRIMSYIYGLLGFRRILADKTSARQTRDLVFKAVKTLESGSSLGITPDGPSGPAMKFKTDSAFLFARKTGAPIVPFYISASRAKFLNTWDRYMLVMPFSRSVCEAGDFVFVPKNASAHDIARIKAELQAIMVKKQNELDKELLDTPRA
ncbi:MAG: DUF374 domain-containing protein [Rickettsiales bacterium]|jgi:lysophospholipid acyltransferase (LPLAT)-like uncharacterized protein|nr:DUF374 domain-containing protein [Rickettsiales bacterium]